MRLTGAQIIVQLLERQGITTIAGIPGGANLPLYDALSQSHTIHHVLARHDDVLANYSLNQHQAPNELTLTVVCERGTLRVELH